MTDRTQEFRAWVRGVYASEAAVEMLARGPRPGMLDDSRPWIEANGNWSVDLGDDYDVITAPLLTTSAAWPTSERAYVDVAVSLLGGDPVQLDEVLPRLTREHLEVVLAAMAHASGSHDHTDASAELLAAGASPSRVGAAYPWPPA
ncbi:hypothetical protein [Demequina gelatinilytica]|uniref:hypothetical protein n=1 Tax=Demequina gelatinilytica TaxID=1638980 RepID=UPI0007839863|nr:hypothetical protein [Demequina gelatinilytica]